jgi:hypothetical protein
MIVWPPHRQTPHHVCPASGRNYSAPVVAEAVSAVSLLLLAASGVSKTLDPDPTTGAMRSAGLPASRAISRSIGIDEIAAAGAGIALGGVWVGGAALLYLGFLLFTVAAVRRRLPIQSCGCFGREDTPPTMLHVGFNAVSAVALTVVALSSRHPVPWSGPALEVVLYLLFAILGAHLAYLVMAQLPRTLHPTGTR